MTNQKTPFASAILTETLPTTTRAALDPDCHTSDPAADFGNNRVSETVEHDLSQYDWVPVLKKARTDGWSPDRQRGFIEALADTGSVMQAAQAVGMSERSAYKLRRSPGSNGFDRAWTVATNTAAKRLLDEAFERALVGSDEPVFNRDGERIGRRFRQSDRMLQFLLRGYFPERFGQFANSGPDLIQPASPDAMSEALTQMVPTQPTEPHLLMASEDLATALEVADILEGKLPHFLSERAASPDGLVDPKSGHDGGMTFD
jgi:hypothetical protein